jgi:hypothetical protein
VAPRKPSLARRFYVEDTPLNLYTLRLLAAQPVLGLIDKALVVYFALRFCGVLLQVFCWLLVRP